MRFKNIAVFGFSDAKPEDKLYQEVTTVAALVAKEGYVIVNGGGPGVMRASTEGAKASGGKTVGITFNPTDMTFFEGRDKENKVDELIECTDYVTRTLRLLEYGDCYIIFNGGTGTLSELGMSWALARLYHGHSKPFILYGGVLYSIIEGKNKVMKKKKKKNKHYLIFVETN